MRPHRQAAGNRRDREGHESYVSVKWQAGALIEVAGMVRSR
jgi:hypothetical protein